MALSYVTYTGNGSQTDFTFPFNYLATTDVFVFVNDVSTAFTWINTSSIRLAVAPASGLSVQVRRVTQKVSAPVNFTDGAVLLETDLDALSTYALYVAQEAQDTVDASLQKDALNVYQAGGLKISNVADGVSPGDAINRSQLDTIAGSTSASAASAAAALASLNEIKGRSYGALVADPTLDPLGAAVTVGDEYFNTTASLLKRFNGATWQASDINTANLAAPSGASLVGYLPSGTGSVATTVQTVLRETVSITRFGANVSNSAADNAASIQAALDTGKAVFIPDGEFTTNPVYPVANQIVYGVGTLKGSGLGEVIRISAGSTNVKLRGFKLKGCYSTTVNSADTGIVVDDTGFQIEDMEISEFSGRGILLQGWPGTYVDMVGQAASISGCYIHDNGCGIETGNFEYVHIDNNRINENGLNYAKTGWATGVLKGAGITGGLSNIGVTNNLIGGNGYGIYCVGNAALNTDHNKIVGNTINHNYAAGMVLQGLKNYELIHSNTMLSNIARAEAPTVVFAPLAAGVDFSMIDCVGVTLIGNTIGGADTGVIPLYGVALCRWTNNNLFGAVNEIRVPDVTAPIFTIYGYTVNADNRFTDNWFYGFEKPYFLPSSIRHSCVGNKENTLGLVDDYQYIPTFATGWVSPSAGGGCQLHYWREGGNRVRVCGSMSTTAGWASLAFTLPVGFRPVGFAQFPCVVDGSGILGYVVVYGSGQVLIGGNTGGSDVSIDITFSV